MANPINVSVIKGQWVKAADNVKTGIIEVRTNQPSDYYKTFRTAGSAAPTGDQNNETSTQLKSTQLQIQSSENIDVYIYCIEENGQVVVSL